MLVFLKDNGYQIPSYCGGKGSCGKCKIKVISGIKEPDKQEKLLLDKTEIKKGVRLACKQKIEDDLIIDIPYLEQMSILTEGNNFKENLNPVLKKVQISASPGDLNNYRGYLNYFYEKLSVNDITFKALKKLNKINSKKEKNIFNVIYDQQKNRIIDICCVQHKKQPPRPFFGLAVDLGTTTIVLYLHNLTNGELIGTFSLQNPQEKYGADVISRIKHTIEQPAGTKELQELLISSLNQSIDEITGVHNIKKKDIYMVSMVGNTALLHFLLGMETESIANSPYIPKFTDSFKISPDIIGLDINKSGFITVLDSISGYIGADITADMLAVNMDQKNNKNELLIDIGTNGEIVLKNDSQITACSTAAGPAFEGANILYGMAGIPGAISSFMLDDTGKRIYKTIGGQKAKGICGSGLLDITASLLEKKIITKQGKIREKKDISDQYQEYITEHKGHRAFIIKAEKEGTGNNKILYTQKDIHELQLAKGAIRAGINILLNKTGIKKNEIDRIYLAGGFGNYLNPKNACKIGLLPEVQENKVIQIGNAAGSGARKHLLNQKSQKRLKNIKKNVKYIELSTTTEFQNEFMKTIQF